MKEGGSSASVTEQHGQRHGQPHPHAAIAKKLAAASESNKTGAQLPAPTQTAWRRASTHRIGGHSHQYHEGLAEHVPPLICEQPPTGEWRNLPAPLPTPCPALYAKKERHKTPHDDAKLVKCKGAQ